MPLSSFPRSRLTQQVLAPTAATCDLYSGEKKVTNVFHYTFAADKPLQRYVLPRTYRQAMQWLDAQRRRKVGIEVRQAYDQAP